MSAVRILVVAGRDPTGGAGVDADRDAARAAGVDVELVVTAETDQDERGVRALGARPVAAWLAEARAALAAAPPDALKLGLLPGAAHVLAAARLCAELRARAPGAQVVLDPVLGASAGGLAFLDAAGRAALLAELLPAVDVATPNLPEAALLAELPEDAPVDPPGGRLRAARALLAAGAGAVVLKGGHAAEDPVRDLLLVAGAPPRWLARPRVAGPGLRGSGCRHATRLAAELALGRPLEEAARRAGDWVGELLAAAGRGAAR